jgi:hypothetical protein
MAASTRRGADSKAHASQTRSTTTTTFREGDHIMNPLILCTAVALNIFSAPAGSTVVGEVPAYQRVYLMHGSLLRDWVFIGKPGESGVSPRGWVVYSGLGQCQW